MNILKRIIYAFFTFLLVLGCKKEFKGPAIKTDLESRGFSGRIKEYTLYISNKSPDKEEQENIKKIHKITFTELGWVKSAEYYDNYGEVERSSISYFNDNKEKIKVIDKHGPSEIITTYKRDTLRNTKIQINVVNDRLRTDYVSIYGAHKRLSKFLIIKNGDTTVRNCEYKFDSNYNVIEYEYETTTKGEKRLEKYKYDNKGNKIEKNYKRKNQLKKEVSEYEGNKLRKVYHYNISDSDKATLISEINYDTYENPISTIIYKDSVSYLNSKKEYTYDEKGNWIIQKNYSINTSSSDKELQLYRIQSREISYWD